MKIGKYVFQKRKLVFVVLLIIVFMSAVMIMIGFSQKDFQLNQFFVYGNTEQPMVTERLANWRSALSLGWQRLVNGYPQNNINYSDPKEFFKYIFSRLPHYAIVYPTETYYYYTAVMGDGVVISGNIRLLDAQSEILHIGYFDKNDPHNPKSELWTGDFGTRDGVSFKQINPYSYDIGYNGKTVRFVLTNFASKKPESITLLPEEEFVTQILDESGIHFVLLFNNKTNSFYDIVNSEKGANENLRDLGSQYYLGERTGYLYYDDEEYSRLFLVGVSSESILKNNYYDGPFDQVPPRLPIKDKLEKAYPYVKYRGGIDEHGNFKEQAGSRVAISPYLDYENSNDSKEYLTRCNTEFDKSIFWSCLTYESKKDFHKILEAEKYPMTESVSNHAVYSSQGWPANHSGSASITWPIDHTQKASSQWKAGYVP